jgi:hypothetical protein
MSWIGKDLIMDALSELGSEDMQRSLWLSDGSSDVSSMSEVIECLYTDSGLMAALEKNELAITPEADKKLLELHGILMKVDQNQKVPLIISDPKMALVREKSNEIVKIING